MLRASILLLTGVLSLCLSGQTPSFSSDVREVSLLATVRDASTGAIVRDLNKDDFVLEEDGRPQTIRYFSQESDLPLVLTFLVDTSQSMRPMFAEERAGSLRFLDRVIREDKDVAAVVHFDVRVGTLQDFTSSREKLAVALNRLKIPPRLQVGTLLYRGIRDSSEDLMRKREGRKAFILLSDGKDVAARRRGKKNAMQRTTISTAIEYAQRADTLIYSILYNRRMMGGKETGGTNIHIGPDPNRGPGVMERLARETGGGYFAVTPEVSLDRIFDQIEEELRHQYSIGYVPDRAATSGEFRQIKLTAVRKGLVVRTRDGYYPR
jgi:VWFA-related protein